MTFQAFEICFVYTVYSFFVFMHLLCYGPGHHWFISMPGIRRTWRLVVKSLILCGLALWLDFLTRRKFWVASQSIRTDVYFVWGSTYRRWVYIPDWKTFTPLKNVQFFVSCQLLLVKIYEFLCVCEELLVARIDFTLTIERLKLYCWPVMQCTFWIIFLLPVPVKGIEMTFQAFEKESSMPLFYCSSQSLDA